MRSVVSYADLTHEDIDRFWSKVSRGGDDECWIWIAGRGTRGYGHFSASVQNRRRTFLAHRVSHYLTTGAIDDALVVMHACDNPSCCNPAHLSQGTVQDNTDDMFRKGRARRALGMAHGQSKLTDDLVKEIRASVASGWSLAKRFGVSPAIIRRIRRGEAWRHVL
jgi:hypothetical protein